MSGVATALLLIASASGQQFGSLDPLPSKGRQYVSFTAEQQVIAANKPAVLELRFHVNEGFHVNSHTPKSELMVSTRIEFQPASDVRLTAAEYPPGRELTFSFDPGEKLEVYSDVFVVKVPVVASSGTHEVKGTLIYQACNRAACYPTRNLPLSILFNAR